MKKQNRIEKLLRDVTTFFARRKASAMTRKFFVRSQSRADKFTAEAVGKWLEREGWRDGKDMLEVSEELGISDSQLSWYFRTVVGVPFYKWRLNRRIEEARRLLVEFPDMPVSTVACKVGISDKSNFRKQFTRLSGCTPVQWRQSKA